MKKIIITSLILFSIILSPVFMTNIKADLPPDPGGGPGDGDDPVGGGSPIGSGLVILLTAGVAYGIRKVYKAKKM